MAGGAEGNRTPDLCSAIADAAMHDPRRIELDFPLKARIAVVVAERRGNRG